MCPRYILWSTVLRGPSKQHACAARLILVKYIPFLFSSLPDFTEGAQCLDHCDDSPSVGMYPAGQRVQPKSLPHAQLNHNRYIKYPAHRLSVLIRPLLQLHPAMSQSAESLSRQPAALVNDHSALGLSSTLSGRLCH